MRHTMSISPVTKHVVGIGVLALLALAALSPPLPARPLSPALAATVGGAARTQSVPEAVSDAIRCTSSQQIGQVRSIIRGLTLQQAHQKRRKARLKTPIFKNELISTKKGQSAAIALCDGSTLYINQQSQIMLRSTLVASLQQGELAETVQPGTQHLVQTLTASGSGTGTQFTVQLQSHSSVFTVLKGTLQVQNKLGKVQVTSNQQTVAVLDHAPQKPIAANAQQAFAWTAPLAWQVFGGFSGPNGVAVDARGNIYVADDGNHRIVKLSSAGTVLASYGSEGSGPGKFENPYGVAVDAQGNIYVADFGADRVDKLSSSGQLLTQWGTTGSAPGQFMSPFSLAVDASGNVYVADWQNDRIQKFSSNGAPLAQWGGRGKLPGHFREPTGVAVDAQGNIYVADWGNSRIQKLSPSGTPLAQWGDGSNNTPLNAPLGVAVDGQGNVYVADTNNNRIQELCPTGQPLTQWGGPYSHDPGQFASPAAVAVDAKFTLYVADTGNDRIQMLPRSGSQPAC